MSDSVKATDVAADLHTGGAAIVALAHHNDLFDSAIKAYRARDTKAWADILARAKLASTTCHRICEWVCSKECVRLCILLAGPPREPITIEQIGPFTTVLVHLAEQPRLLEALVHAVEAEDPKAFRTIAAELKAEPYLHLLCHWICFVRAYLICETLCEGVRFDLADLIGKLRQSAAQIASIAKNKDQLERVIEGAARLDCTELKRILGEGRDCSLICFWLCSWRCLIVCLRLTHGFPMGGDFSIAEMRAFALFCGELLRDEIAAEKFAAAVLQQDERAFVELVREWKAEKFVHQLCHWICYLVCRRLCTCVCPPPGVIPIFDHVGAYRVDPYFGNFTAAGTTTAGSYAFTGGIPLLGLLPASPASDPIEYRFTVQKLAAGPVPAGPVQPLTANDIGGTVIGSLEYWEWDASLLPPGGHWTTRTTDFSISNAPVFIDIKQEFGPPLHVQVSTPVDANGWVQVPSIDNLIRGGAGVFTPTHTLATLDTTQLTFEQFDLHGPGAGLPIVAGSPVPSAQRSEKPVFTIVFEARKVNGQAAISSNALPAIALSNMRFAFDRHPDWAGSTISFADNYPLALLLDIEELIGAGCNPLTPDAMHPNLHADYTAYHPYLATCSVYIDGPTPLPPEIDPVPDATGQVVSPAGGEAFDISALKPCAYILWLKATLNLTSGYGAIGGVYDDHIAFCIH